MADGTANGTFGPGTRQGVRDHALLAQGSTDTAKYYVHLFQAALTFNTFSTAYDGTFSASTKSKVEEFQTFVALPATGQADFATWASLLVSTGDTARPGTAADCITQVTPARATTLVSHGYQTVGRYLTNAPAMGSLNKKIQPGELAAIFGAGLSVFPIYQEVGRDPDNFDRDKGFDAGRKAHEAAISYGFKRGTTIYFAVDFDAFDTEIADFVLPYFGGVRNAISQRGSVYEIGVYGSRNTCATVSRQGFAKHSFVAGMSSGFSGNLGYPLPPNWAFDQILEYSIGSGAGQIGIDKNIKSGRDGGQTSVTTPDPAGLLDVPLPASMRDDLLGDAVDWLNANMSVGQKLAANRSRELAVQIMFAADPLITDLARGYRMRKSLIQTAFLWEVALLGPDDFASDTQVITTYSLHFDGLPNPAPRWDCSTGMAQIFAATAIAAINWGRQASRQLTIQQSRDAGSPTDMWEIWKGLYSDENYNTLMCALVLLHKGALAGVGNNYLTWTAADIKATLSGYNGSTDYGDLNYGLYEILEGYNASARSF